jgi:succinate dehydrogenase/fumarate reductase flavoprotein subunit
MQKRSEPTVLNTDLMSNIYDASSDAFTYLDSWGFPIYTAKWNLGTKDSQLPSLSSTEAQKQSWETGEAGFADFMEMIARNAGVDIRTNSRVTKLVAEGTRVTGVEVETLDSTYTVNAKKVILASGGFTRNPDLITKYAPEFESGFAFTGSGGTGDAIALTEELGATVVGTGMMGLYGVNPSYGYYGPIGNLVYCAAFSVNAEGEDMQLSSYFYADRLLLLCQQTNNRAYGIADATSEYAERFETGVAAGVIFKYDSLDELASDRGIDSAGLAALAQEYAVSQAPFYCVEQRPLFIGSIPGLKVGANCEVLTAADEPIENLFAVGEVMFGNVFSNAYPASGTGIGTGCYTGAVAAKAAKAAL